MSSEISAIICFFSSAIICAMQPLFILQGMMKRLGLSVFIFSLILADLFATQAEFKMIKELEEMQKTPLESIVRPKVTYKSGNLRDPFQKVRVEETKPVTPSVSETVEKPPEPPSLTVQGLIWGGSFPQAIINNKVVKEGDTIEEAKVISIDKDGVTVFFQQRHYKLPSPAARVNTSKNP